jgi:PAS domain S-box-containing protein
MPCCTESLAFQSHEAMVITDARGFIIRINAAYSAITGFIAADAIGKTPGELMRSGRQGIEFYRQMWQQLTRDGVWSGELSGLEQTLAIQLSEQ